MPGFSLLAVKYPPCIGFCLPDKMVPWKERQFSSLLCST